VDPLIILAISSEEREKVVRDLRSAEDAEDKKDDANKARASPEMGGLKAACGRTRVRSE